MAGREAVFQEVNFVLISQERIGSTFLFFCTQLFFTIGII